ncbi:hypothetical protein BB559_001879, partial [Furculomyces boomerangus]
MKALILFGIFSSAFAFSEHEYLDQDQMDAFYEDAPYYKYDNEYGQDISDTDSGEFLKALDTEHLEQYGSLAQPVPKQIDYSQFLSTYKKVCIDHYTDKYNKSLKNCLGKTQSFCEESTAEDIDKPEYSSNLKSCIEKKNKRCNKKYKKRLSNLKKKCQRRYILIKKNLKGQGLIDKPSKPKSSPVAATQPKASVSAPAPSTSAPAPNTLPAVSKASAAASKAS